MRRSIPFVLALAAGSAVTPACGAITAQWVPVTITQAAIDDDPQLGGMQSLSLMVTQSAGTWASAGIRATLPAGSFFYKHPLGGNTYPNPALFASAPALEFTSYVRAQADNGTNNATAVLGSFPEGSPDGPSVGNQTQSPPGTPGNFNFSFGQIGHPPPTPHVPFEIMRLTIPMGISFTTHSTSFTSSINPEVFVGITPPFFIFNNHWVPDADGSWHIPANWNLGRVPSSDDIVMIDVGGDPIRTIEYSQGNTHVWDIRSKEHLLLTGGTLSVLTPGSLTTASLTISGGTLRFTTVNGAPAVFGPAGGRLHNITLNQGMVVAHPAQVVVESGLRLNGVSTISTGATLRFEGSQTLGGSGTVAFEGRGRIDITAGSTLTLASTLRVQKTGGEPLRINGRFAQAAGSTINLIEGSIVNDYTGDSPLATIRTNIISGYNDGAWDGAGINSSTAAADDSFAVGYSEAAALFTTFPAIYEGEQIDDTTVIVRLTRAGDANLDGIVNLADFNRLAASFGSTSAGWSEGDFNYDGIVNLADFNKLAANFGLVASGTGGPTPEDWSALAAAVPEPGAAAWIAFVWPVLRRRRRIGYQKLCRC